MSIDIERAQGGSKFALVMITFPLVFEKLLGPVLVLAISRCSSSLSLGLDANMYRTTCYPWLSRPMDNGLYQGPKTVRSNSGI